MLQTMHGLHVVFPLLRFSLLFLLVCCFVIFVFVLVFTFMLKKLVTRLTKTTENALFPVVKKKILLRVSEKMILIMVRHN